MAKVSVIIPVYNGEKHIKNMLEAVRCQTLEDIEVIIVNDGSTDNTQEIIDSYTAADTRFKSFYQENKGASAARNRGIREAAGEYIAFRDADDIIPEGSLEEMAAAGDKGDADLVIGKMTIRRLSGTSPVKSTGTLSRMDSISKYEKRLVWSFSVCNKLFRTAMIKAAAISFDEIYTIIEDGLFVMRCIQQCNIICGCNALVYEQIKRPFWEDASITQDINIKHIEFAYEAMQSIYSIISESINNDKTEWATSGEKREDTVKKNIYIDTLFCRFAKSDLLYLCYSNIWRNSFDLTDKIREYLEICKREMFQETWNDLVNDNPHLKLEDGIKTKEQIAAKPLISIVISDSVYGTALNMILKSIYCQQFIFFEVIVSEKQAGFLHEEYVSKDNFHVISKFEGYKKNAKGDYLMLINDETWLGENTLMKMYYTFKEIPKAQCVIASFRKYDNGNVRKMDRQESDQKRKSSTSNKLFKSNMLLLDDFPEVLINTQRAKTIVIDGGSYNE